MLGSLRGCRILVVEDEALIAWTLADALEEAGAEPVGPVASAAAGLEQVGREALDGAILDGDLADGRSTPVALALAARGVPFVFHTASVRPEALEPLAPVIPKPAPATQVLERLAAAMAGPAPAGRAVA
jgi:CheY-like chemotaxis protein